jgi:diadenosine tetraphosphate (Ap4A) HIT family hydrolase
MDEAHNDSRQQLWCVTLNSRLEENKIIENLMGLLRDFSTMTDHVDFLYRISIYAIRDKYPVTQLHTLIISKQHDKTVFNLPPVELDSIFELAKICRGDILKEDSSVKGFNFGSNAGSVAGQKMRPGDTNPPPARYKLPTIEGDRAA